ncbi:MAG: hypothetical protein WD512_00670 [Candidatus Paceibacterota bacterium]
MLNKSYKEVEYVESLLNKKATDRSIGNDLKILAKYYKSQRKPPKEPEELLYKYCNTKGKSWFKEVIHFKLVDAAVNHSRKKENIIVNVDSVSVTKNEINYINSMDLDKLEKKILFAFIVTDKLKKEKMRLKGLQTDKNKENHYFGGAEFTYRTMLDSLQEKITRTFKEKGIHTTIKKFNEMGLTRTARKSSVELLFIDDIEEDSEVAVEVLDFDKIGLYYDYYIGDEKIKKCEKCEVLIKVSGNRTKYCKDCWEKKQRELWRESKRRERNVQV